MGSLEAQKSERLRAGEGWLMRFGKGTRAVQETGRRPLVWYSGNESDYVLRTWVRLNSMAVD